MAKKIQQPVIDLEALGKTIRAEKNCKSTCLQRWPMFKLVSFGDDTEQYSITTTDGALFVFFDNKGDYQGIHYHSSDTYAVIREKK